MTVWLRVIVTMTTEFEGCEPWAADWAACDVCGAAAVVVATVVAAPGRGASVTVLCTPERAREESAVLESGAVESAALEVATAAEVDVEACVALETSGNVVWDAEAGVEEEMVVMRVEEDVLGPRGKVSLLLLA